MAPDGGTNAAIADLFTTHALDLLRLEASERREVQRFLTDLEAEISAAIAKVDPTGPARHSYRVRRLEKLLEQVKDTIRASYRGTARYLAGELAELADIEVDFVTRALNNGIGFDMASASITRETARSLVAGVLVQGAPVADWWSRQAGDTFERFQDAMRQGIAQGETNAQLIRRVRGGRQNGEQIVGFMDVTRRNAESLVRSATQAVSERARQEAYEQNADILSAVVWTSTLDARTTVLCMVRDGLRYEPVTNKPIGHDVPWLSGPGNLHWGCRSASRPETKDWRELGFDIGDLPPGTRASMDGQVAGDTTFEAWLSRQSKAAQDAALGTGRAGLWRDGTITFRQLLDANGRELTLDQLRARVRS